MLQINIANEQQCVLVIRDCCSSIAGSILSSATKTRTYCGTDLHEFTKRKKQLSFGCINTTLSLSKYSYCYFNKFMAKLWYFVWLKELQRALGGMQDNFKKISWLMTLCVVCKPLACTSRVFLCRYIVNDFYPIQKVFHDFHICFNFVVNVTFSGVFL